MIELSIVIPAYNEQENLPILVQGITDALSEKATFEVVIVDDASTDDTQHICRQLKKKHSHLTYLRHVKNSGQSASIYTGVIHARFPLIVTLDGDGQNPPAEVKKLLEAHGSYLGSAETTLFAGHRQKRQDPWVKRISSKVANKIRGYLLNDHCPDTGCGLKLFYQKAFLTLPHFNHMHRFLPALYKRNGFSVINVPIQHAPRQFGVSKYNTWGRLRVGIIDLLGVAWLARRPCHPIIEENDHE